MATYENRTLALKPEDMARLRALLARQGLSLAAWVRLMVKKEEPATRS